MQGANAAKKHSPFRETAKTSKPQSVDKVTANWKCIKRDKTKIKFDVTKITEALTKCIKAVREEQLVSNPEYPDHTDKLAKVTASVVAALATSKEKEFHVEKVQQAVIAQLWLHDLAAEAEHYQNYREYRRRQRAAMLSREVVNAVAEDRKAFPTDLQYFQFMDKFARWKETEKRRETWREACFERVLPWMFNLPKVKGKLTDAEMKRMGELVHSLQVSPAMRVVQMAGPALDRDNVGAFNCSYLPIIDLKCFAELLYICMQGTGVGFSVEAENIDLLPPVKKQIKDAEKVTLIVEDTTESWCDTLYQGLQLLFDGRDYVLDTTKVRKKNAPLKTKGGRASGPEPLHELMDYVRRIVTARQGRRLRDIDVHDICCMAGNIVQVGGVRRSALISLSDLDSLEMQQAKSGDWYTKNVHRVMANNSAVYYGRPPILSFMKEWDALIRSQSGERGIVNRQALEKVPGRRIYYAGFGCNPCAEIVLRPFQFCNLSIVVARYDDTEETLTEKVVWATYFGTIQATATKFTYIREEWTKNSEEEALLGVDITGQLDCPLLQPSNPDRDALLQRLKAKVLEVNKMLAARFGINESAASTCVKPSGDSSVFFDCGAGISARFAKKQLRWVRCSKQSPLAAFLRDQGVPSHDAPERPNDLDVFGFLKKAPETALVRNDLNAIQQLENWLSWKRNWAEHSVSATIYVDSHEWLAVGSWVYDHFDEITGLSFLPKDNGIYEHSPNEELTDEQYAEIERDFPEIQWGRYPSYEQVDMTEGSQTFACVGGSCDMG